MTFEIFTVDVFGDRSDPVEVPDGYLPFGVVETEDGPRIYFAREVESSA